ncbi:sensor domain-containing diguanylate cyclase [Nereida sp. MMG025]|uniref:sensor domain-containing diguanylate cyclase n=1 Tax=Nereida sp. MMG025 TaxID=2909981 RepID=UPI001F38F604|nr:sensor domain-containing diguanylate cyclase [Nereida sp. MMG025]MCF6445116.1 diguanylate cyclase [Nereida sp. MMG025]
MTVQRRVEQRGEAKADPGLQDPDWTRAVFDRLMPMHLLVCATGHILHTGPTLQKILPEGSLVGQRFLEVFRVLRPSNVQAIAPLMMADGMKLHLSLRRDAKTAFKGVAVADQNRGLITINLSFGIGIVDAVRRFNLTGADFAPNDLTIEMLYLIEAKSAAMEESRQLNTRLQTAMIAAEERAFTDGLTGLKNRRAMDHLLTQAAADDAPFAVMNIDLDFFKSVNDTLGHAAGDHVLIRVAEILNATLREADHIARVGGDEFMVILTDATKPSHMLQTAKKLIAQIETPIPYGDQMCRISASIGIAVSGDYADPAPDTMSHDADVALYASKRRGRAQATLYTAELGDMTENSATVRPTRRDGD